MRNGLDRLHCHSPLRACLHQGLEIFAVVRVLNGDVVVGQQNRIEVEALETSPMCCGDLGTMACHADPLDQTLLSRSQTRIKGSCRASCLAPFDWSPDSWD